MKILAFITEPRGHPKNLGSPWPETFATKSSSPAGRAHPSLSATLNRTLPLCPQPPKQPSLLFYSTIGVWPSPRKLILDVTPFTSFATFLRELWTPEFHRAYVQEFERNGRGHERLAKLFLDGDRIKIEAQHHLPPELAPYYRRIRQVHPERGVRYSGHAFPEYVARTLVAPELWPKGARAELVPLGAAMPGVGGSDSGSAGDRWIRPPRPGAAMQPDPEPSPRRGWLYYLYPQMPLFERGRDIMRDKREK